MKAYKDLLISFTTFLLTEKRVSKNTYLAYERDLKQFFAFMEKNRIGFGDVSEIEIKSYLKSLKDSDVSTKSIARKIASLKSFFKFLEMQEEFENKAQNIATPKVEKNLPNFLTDEEILKLFSFINKDKSIRGIRNKVIIQLLYASGMRVSELISLKIDQIHFDTGFLNLMGKGNKERSIPIPVSTLALLRDYIDHIYWKLLPQNAPALIKVNYLFPIFINGNIQNISRQTIWNVLKKLLHLAGINKNISPHSLRHSLATHMLKNGANVRFLQMLLGHEQISTVQIYTHLETSNLRKIYDKAHPRA